jgi:hypothetical protein
MVHCLGQILDSTVVQDRWLRRLADAADLSDACESLAGSIDGLGSVGSSNDGSSEQETESEPDSDSSDAD